MGAAAACTLHTNTPPLGGAMAGGKGALHGAGNRFGYRGSIRPSSTDITGRYQKEANDNIENNNCIAPNSNTKGGLVSNCKYLIGEVLEKLVVLHLS